MEKNSLITLRRVVQFVAVVGSVAIVLFCFNAVVQSGHYETYEYIIGDTLYIERNYVHDLTYFL